MEEDNENWVIIDSLDFISKNPFNEEITHKMENPSYYLVININDDGKPKKTSPFNINPNEPNTITLKLKFKLNGLLSIISFSLFETGGKEVLQGGIKLSKHDSTLAGINTLKCNLMNNSMQQAGLITITYIRNTDSKNEAEELSPIDIFNNYIQNVTNSTIKNGSKKEKGMLNVIKDKKFSLLDLATGANTENFNMFVHNMDYMREILSEIVDFVQWKNPYKTFSLLAIISLLMFYSSFLILVVIPLLLILFHLCNKEDLVNSYTYKNANSDRVANLHLIMWIIELVNTLIGGYESLMEAMQATSKELALEIYFNIVKFAFINLITYFFFHFTCFQIDIKIVIVITLWIGLLYQYPPFRAFCFVLYTIINKSLSGLDLIFAKLHANINSRKGLKNLIYTIIPFLDTGLRFYNIATTKEEISLNEVVKDLSNIPTTILVPDNTNAESTSELLKYELYENERWWIGVGWKKKLFSSDGATWRRVDSDSYCDMKMIHLPDTDEYEWNSEWKIELNGNSDDNGWEYGSSFKEGKEFGVKKASKYVRRRKWVRYAKKVK